MARPKKETVDYFPHVVNHGKTLFIFEQKYGNNGYSFWFKLLEILGATAGHYIDCSNEAAWEFLQAKTHLSEDICVEMLDLLAKLDAIDPELWGVKVIWSQNFVNGISQVYINRRVETPSRPSFYTAKPTNANVSTVKSTQTKLKETKLEEIKDIVGQKPAPDYAEIIDYFNQACGTNYRSGTAKTQTLIRARYNEGFNIEDFKKVIDKKSKEWRGTDMAKYLRPETLFGTKFESYLNQADGAPINAKSKRIESTPLWMEEHRKQQEKKNMPVEHVDLKELKNLIENFEAANSPPQ